MAAPRSGVLAAVGALTLRFAAAAHQTAPRLHMRFELGQLFQADDRRGDGGRRCWRGSGRGWLGGRRGVFHASSLWRAGGEALTRALWATRQQRGRRQGWWQRARALWRLIRRGVLSRRGLDGLDGLGSFGQRSGRVGVIRRGAKRDGIHWRLLMPASPIGGGMGGG